MEFRLWSVESRVWGVKCSVWSVERVCEVLKNRRL